jgi:hypothetical protein
MAALEGESGRIKVPVDQVAAAAYRIVFGRLGRVLELAWLPLLVLLTAELVPGLITDYLWPDAFADATAGMPGIDIAGSIVAMLCFSAFAVRWHHLMLAADRPLPRRRFLAVWARFVAYSLPFYAPIVAAMTVPAILGAGAVAADDVVAIVTIIASLALSRCSLVFPAVVIGQPLGLVAAWRRMRGNTWRFVAATLLVTAPIMLAVAVLFDLILMGAHLQLPDALAHPPLGLFLLNGVLDVALPFLFVALGTTVLADFYRRLVLHPRAGQP